MNANNNMFLNMLLYIPIDIYTPFSKGGSHIMYTVHATVSVVFIIVYWC